jgi:hypothetical protein
VSINLVQIDPKLAGETCQRMFDFTSKLQSGESISTQSCAASVYSGNDSSPSSIVNGAATASGTVVTQSFTAGVSGCVYQIICTITTNLSNTLQLHGYMAVLPGLV